MTISTDAGAYDRPVNNSGTAAVEKSGKGAAGVPGRIP